MTGQRGYQPLFVLYRSAVMKYVDEPVRFSGLDRQPTSLVASNAEAR